MDMDNIKIALQGYNYGNGSFAGQRNGTVITQWRMPPHFQSGCGKIAAMCQSPGILFSLTGIATRRSTMWGILLRARAMPLKEIPGIGAGERAMIWGVPGLWGMECPSINSRLIGRLQQIRRASQGSSDYDGPWDD
ncbi:hypothetical protein P0G10_05285 [Eubacteriales bacterium DFI.9.88]|nr:hypothetical protein [Eubacteriales bacterium DFI.9.88]